MGKLSDKLDKKTYISKLDSDEVEKWYSERGFEKTPWGYEVRSECGKYTQGIIFDVSKYEEEIYKSGGIIYDTLPRPCIRELAPGEGAIVKTGG